ncbi:MAG: DUF2147 domain-containing protein [Pseudomonadota bacterium]
MRKAALRRAAGRSEGRAEGAAAGRLGRRWLVAALLLGALAPSPAAADVTGIWFTEKRDNGAFISVRISPCRFDREKRCGTVAGAHGGARPDIVGEPILRNMERRDDGRWAGGEILRPGKDEAYSSEIRIVDGGLEVKGCVAAGLICQSQLWTRSR